MTSGRTEHRATVAVACGTTTAVTFSAALSAPWYPSTLTLIGVAILCLWHGLYGGILAAMFAMAITKTLSHSLLLWEAILVGLGAGLVAPLMCTPFTIPADLHRLMFR